MTDLEWDILDMYDLEFSDEEIAEDLELDVEIVTKTINDAIARGVIG